MLYVILIAASMRNLDRFCHMQSWSSSLLQNICQLRYWIMSSQLVTSVSCLSGLCQCAASVGRLCYGILIAPATWDLCRRSWSSLLCGILITSIMRNHGCFHQGGPWSPRLCKICAASVGRLRYRILVASAMFISTKQV